MQVRCNKVTYITVLAHTHTHTAKPAQVPKLLAGTCNGTNGPVPKYYFPVVSMNM